MTRRLLRSRLGLAIALLADLALYASERGPYDYTASSFEIALAAQERVTEDWLALEGVVGTAIGVDGAGHAVLKVYLTAPGIALLPPKKAEKKEKAEGTEKKDKE